MAFGTAECSGTCCHFALVEKLHLGKGAIILCVAGIYSNIELITLRFCFLNFSQSSEVFSVLRGAVFSAFLSNVAYWLILVEVSILNFGSGSNGKRRYQSQPGFGADN